MLMRRCHKAHVCRPRTTRSAASRTGRGLACAWRQRDPGGRACRPSRGRRPGKMRPRRPVSHILSLAHSRESRAIELSLLTPARNGTRADSRARPLLLHIRRPPQAKAAADDKSHRRLLVPARTAQEHGHTGPAAGGWGSTCARAGRGRWRSSCAVAMEKPRQVARKFLARPQHEGAGAVVRRSIGRFELRYFDPFLVLDEFSVSAPAGFPDHPHRGFETVTYMLEGAVTHEDFEGHRGTIKAGDVQWMTAGRGIVHSEMPAGPGTSKGLQLWVNLSSGNKMIEPGYQEIQSKDIACTSADGVTVRVIAGRAMGAVSPVCTRTPTMYLDFTVRPRAAVRQPVPPAWNAFAYVLEGEGVFGADRCAPVAAHHLLLLGQGDGLEVWNKSDRPLRFLLIAGEPIGEPVAQLGPFVMNTEEEIDMTVDDFERYANGFEKARHWKSQAMVALGVDVE
ncbi:hypothetical protein BS78_02G222200 [Paspalum vaginatum]|nr:hypothetical protein BS78_02G222200 [Paspalum vaginatum]